MLIVFSHIAAFCVLFIGAIFDLETTEVPDQLNILGVMLGLGIHLAASFPIMDFNTILSSALISNPIAWLTALGEPLVWSLGVGIAFSIYGWGLYFLGMWGGADAFAMSVLGFAAPYSLAGPGVFYPASLLTSVLIAGFAYTLIFGLFKASKNPEVLRNTWADIVDNERRVSLEIIGAAMISGIAAFTSIMLGATYFVVLLFLILLYRLFLNIQEDLMVEEVPVEKLEGGEVLDEDEPLGGKIEGIKEEEIEDLEKDSVTVREGIRFVPVFPIALVLVDIFGFRLSWLFLLFSL